MKCCQCDLSQSCYNEDDYDVGLGSEMLSGYYYCPYDNDVHNGSSDCNHPEECKKYILEQIEYLKSLIE